jgi:hypothetical protein
MSNARTLDIYHLFWNFSLSHHEFICRFVSFFNAVASRTWTLAVPVIIPLSIFDTYFYFSSLFAGSFLSTSNTYLPTVLILTNTSTYISCTYSQQRQRFTFGRTYQLFLMYNCIRMFLISTRPDAISYYSQPARLSVHLFV